MILPDLEDRPRHYRIALPAKLGWITENQRGSWQPKARLIRAWRSAARWHAHSVSVPHLPGGHVVAELRFCDARRRDPHNWMPTAKACMDGFVDAGVFPDDNSRYVDGPDMRIGPKAPKGFQQIVFHIWPREATE